MHPYQKSKPISIPYLTENYSPRPRINHKDTNYLQSNQPRINLQLPLNIKCLLDTSAKSIYKFILHVGVRLNNFLHIISPHKQTGNSRFSTKQHYVESILQVHPDSCFSLQMSCSYQFQVKRAQQLSQVLMSFLLFVKGLTSMLSIVDKLAELLK